MLYCGLCLLLFMSVGTVSAKPMFDKSQPIEWLFVITSKQGEITINSSGDYVLTLNHVHIERVLAFTDRPNRMVKMIPLNDFKALWSEGKNSFEEEPPNAVAVFGQKKIPMKLMHIVVQKDKTSFIVSNDDDKLRPMRTQKVTLFIDS